MACANSRVMTDGAWSGAGNDFGLAQGDAMRRLLNQMSARFAVASGARGFFAARTGGLKPGWHGLRPPASTIRVVDGKAVSNDG
jgi:hypothetical protein